MKKVIVLILAAIAFCGCDNSSYRNKEIHDLSEYRARRFQYNEHDYINFDVGYGAVVHDPDCRKCKKEENLKRKLK